MPSVFSYPPFLLNSKRVYRTLGRSIWMINMINMINMDGHLSLNNNIKEEKDDGHHESIAAAVGDEFLLMQDNARPHIAGITRDFLEEETIQTLDWPAKSPDRNPLEHLWDRLKRSVNKSITPATNLEGLRRILIRKWREIDQNDVRRLIRSMRRRLAAVYENDAGHTRY